MCSARLSRGLHAGDGRASMVSVAWVVLHESSRMHHCTVIIGFWRLLSAGEVFSCTQCEAGLPVHVDCFSSRDRGFQPSLPPSCGGRLARLPDYMILDSPPRWFQAQWACLPLCCSAAVFHHRGVLGEMLRVLQLSIGVTNGLEAGRIIEHS